jgi:hypothetical protein
VSAPWEIVFMQRPELAVAAALRLLADDNIFSRYKLGSLVETIVGAAERDHIAFARSGGKLCGFLSWGLTREIYAERWLRTGEMPSEGDGRSGDVVVLLMGVARKPDTVRGGLRHLGWLYPGKRFVFARAGTKGRHFGRFPDGTGGTMRRVQTLPAQVKESTY